MSFILQTTAPQEERLYLFQFPSPFPSFAPPGGFPPPDGISDGAASSSKLQPAPLSIKGEPGSLKTAASQQQTTAPEPTIDGVIGELVVYRSGAVKMRLASGILLDVCLFDAYFPTLILIRRRRSMPPHNPLSFSKRSILT